MKNHFVKILFLALCCAGWPGGVHAEMLHATPANPDWTTSQSRSDLYPAGGNIKTKKSIKWKIYTAMVQKSLLQKWVGKPRSKQKLIWAVIILALGFVIYSLLIVGGVVFAFELANNVGQVILYLLGSLLFLGLLVVAVQEMIRAVKELRMLKREKVH